MTTIEELEKRNKPIPRREQTVTSYSLQSSAETVAERMRRIHGPSDPLGRAEWLIERAEALEDEANRLEGTCWVGGMSPSAAKRNEAAQLREHAALLLEKARKRHPQEPR